MNKIHSRHHFNGFTLIEILLVIAIMAILASIVIIAMNPAKHMADSRDAEREADVYTLVQSLFQYASDNEGAFPQSISELPTEICLTEAPNCTNLVDLSMLTDSSAYMIETPTDPLCGNDPNPCAEYGTGYFVNLTENGRVRVFASSSEQRIIIVEQ